MSTIKDNSGEEIILSYQDCLLRRNDVDLLRGSHWLNDAIIGFYYEYLDQKFNNAEKENSKKYLFVSPEMTQLLKFSNPSDYSDLINDLNFKECEYIFFPVNNCDSRESAGGTHWSLLVFSKTEETFFHLDSCRGTNKIVVATFVKKLMSYLYNGEEQNLQEIDCPQQDNGSDCGVFTICFTDAVLQHLSSDNDGIQGCNFSGVRSIVRTKRQDLLDLIDELKKAQESNK